jgi:hydrogenase expression/formation protein HypD
MKYVDEFRAPGPARELAKRIDRATYEDRRYRLMEFCGGHTHAVFRYGVQDLLPANVQLIHGPGCPVCVLPIGRLDNAIALAEQHGAIVCSYSDMLRVPASGRHSLIKAKAAGADIRSVYSSLDALRVATENPGREVVFFAIGFETTTPATAVAVKEAERLNVANFSVFCNHVLTPAAMRAILSSPEPGAVAVDGLLGPSHVSTVIGSQPYQALAEEFQQPVVIAGFEPLDIMLSILMLVRQLNDGRHEVENEYIRAVTRDGNRKAKRLMKSVFELRSSFEWRGLGAIPESALKLKPLYRRFDAEHRFPLAEINARDVKGCECPAILRGTKKPVDCKLFGRVCTPENPMGSCMVSAEGACAAYWSYGRQRDYAGRELKNGTTG